MKYNIIPKKLPQNTKKSLTVTTTQKLDNNELAQRESEQKKAA